MKELTQIKEASNTKNGHSCSYRYSAPVKSNSTNSVDLVSPKRYIYTAGYITLTYCPVDGTNNDEGCHEVECPEQRSKGTQGIPFELNALAMEEDGKEGENTEGTHLENESCN